MSFCRKRQSEEFDHSQPNSCLLLPPKPSRSCARLFQDPSPFSLSNEALLPVQHPQGIFECRAPSPGDGQSRAQPPADSRSVSSVLERENEGMPSPQSTPVPAIHTLKQHVTRKPAHLKAAIHRVLTLSARLCKQHRCRLRGVLVCLFKYVPASSG